jgi:alanine racemase
MDIFFTFLQKLRARGSTPAHSLLTVELSRAALIHNIVTLQTATDWPLSPVLKSNAYGHGLVEIARMIEDAQKVGALKKPIPFISVDSYYEALTLRKAGITLPLLIIGYTPTETLRIARLPSVTYAITSHDQVNELALEQQQKSLPHLNIHLKVDTGMHRQGIRADEISEALKTLANIPSIQVTGAYSHFADSDGDTDETTLEQIDVWAAAVKAISAAYPDAREFHIANTAGLAFVKAVRDKAPLTTIGRLGLGLYGISTLPEQKRVGSDERKAHLDLRPVMAVYSEISGTKKLLAGETVGYNNTFIAPHDMRIATLPAGYFEGIPRGLSNIGMVEVYTPEQKTWVQAPYIGRISMNISTIDISHLPPETGLHTPVRLVSPFKMAPNSMEVMALRAGTIPHDAIVDIPSHLRRVIVAEHRR